MNDETGRKHCGKKKRCLLRLLDGSKTLGCLNNALHLHCHRLAIVENVLAGVEIYCWRFFF